jgi:hypothetical protein
MHLQSFFKDISKKMIREKGVQESDTTKAKFIFSRLLQKILYTVKLTTFERLFPLPLRQKLEPI